MYSNAHTQQYRAYANAAMTVGKLRQVVMLYDGAIRFVQQAADAIEQKDYAARYNLLVKATDILSGLQSSIDHESGGEIAKLLYDYYASLDARIFAVHRSNDSKALEAVLKELRMMRDAWHAIDQAEKAQRPVPAASAPSLTPAVPLTEGRIGVSA